MMGVKSLRDIPKLRVSPRLRAPEFPVGGGGLFAPRGGERRFHYESRAHREWPHVVKFSGGKTSGMLLFILLEAGVLKAERGDVVVFNNTSAEHPKTYEFARQCKRVVEGRYKMPFFWIEYQTYEDARHGEYVRLPSFRLVNTQPFSESNPNGYRHRGEVFEEMLSHKGYVPSVFKRICTQSLKLESSRLFLREWLANKEQTERLGHFGEGSRMDEAAMFARHLRHGGGAGEGGGGGGVGGSEYFDIYRAKKAFVRDCAPAREAQKWRDYSSKVVAFNNKELEGRVYGRKAHFGRDGIAYLSFVGIRSDEGARVVRIRQRNCGNDNKGYEGEHVYMPLADMGISERDVLDFWGKQTWRLELNSGDNLSNCTFCFLKGVRKLGAAKAALEREWCAEYENTPCDIRWWAAIEKKYGRDLKAEGRKIRSSVADDFIGFFGTSKKLSYERLVEDGGVDKGDIGFADGLPCDCTD